MPLRTWVEPDLEEYSTASFDNVINNEFFREFLKTISSAKELVDIKFELENCVILHTRKVVIESYAAGFSHCMALVYENQKRINR